MVCLYHINLYVMPVCYAHVTLTQSVNGSRRPNQHKRKKYKKRQQSIDMVIILAIDSDSDS